MVRRLHGADASTPEDIDAALQACDDRPGLLQLHRRYVGLGDGGGAATGRPAGSLVWCGVCGRQPGLGSGARGPVRLRRRCTSGRPRPLPGAGAVPGLLPENEPAPAAPGQGSGAVPPARSRRHGEEGAIPTRPRAQASIEQMVATPAFFFFFQFHLQCARLHSRGRCPSSAAAPLLQAVPLPLHGQALHSFGGRIVRCSESTASRAPG